MVGFRDVQLPPPVDENDFERLCLSLWRRLLNNPHTQLNGRRGQRQGGVDLFGRRGETTDWVGVQCKVRSSSGLSEAELVAEVEKAKSFNPKLKEFVVATTSKRDAALQEIARILSEVSMLGMGFSVNVYSWDDIRQELLSNENLDLLQRYYTGFFLDVQKRGISLSKLITIRVGGKDGHYSCYEILLGKTPSLEDSRNYYGLNYWRGLYYIVNLNDMQIRKFKIPLHHTDIAGVFKSEFDARIVTKWMESVEDLDELIYNEESELDWTVSEDDIQEIHASLLPESDDD